MKKKKKLIALLLAAGIAAFLCGCGEEEVAEETETIKEVPVEIAMVERGGISAESNVSGQIASGDSESVYVALSVRCIDAYVKMGDTVSAGQTICTLDMESTWNNYESASMSYENTKKSYEDQSAILAEQIALAEKNVNDTRQLFAIGAASQAEVDAAQLALDNALAGRTAALSQLELGMQNYKASMDQLESSLVNIDRSGNVTAPISGTVASISAAKNSYVSAGMPVITIDSTAAMEVDVAVSENLVSKIHTGDSVKVGISSVGRTFNGSISEISAAANAINHLYSVTISIPQSAAAGLLTGMFADVTFYTDSQSNAIVIPTEAIQTGTDGQYVYTLDGENVAHRITVETGLVGDGVTEITSGLAGGERLVTVGQFYLSEGTHARVTSSEV